MKGLETERVTLHGSHRGKGSSRIFNSMADISRYVPNLKALLLSDPLTSIPSSAIKDQKGASNDAAQI